MSTQKNTSTRSEDIKNTVSKIKVWLVTFAASAIVTIASVIAENQSVITTGVMIVAAAMVALHGAKYDTYFETPVVASVKN